MRGAVPAPALHPWHPPEHLGARLEADGRCSFRVWAPHARGVELLLPRSERRLRMEAGAEGYFALELPGLAHGERYGFALDDGPALPDPASRWQPEGVHGASALVARTFDWKDAAWRGLPLADYVIYELHLGTFTPEGTFDAAITRLAELRDLGITAVELLPIAQFPGTRNWGYDGVFPFAAQHSYGGPQALRRFVDAAHAVGLAVVLDVVYNHLGPEGNYLPRFGPYFTNRYRTPWGEALNFDGEHSDHVRAFFIASALQWVDEFHIDALRLDAVHAIIDGSAYPFLRELADAVRARGRELGREIVLIAESDLADPRVILPGEQHGLGMDAQWLDDFHHALHTLLTGERQGYYADFGELAHLARSFQQGYVYAGDYSRFRRRRHGLPARAARPEQFVVFAQNHDQVGNRLAGDRLSTVLEPASLRLAAAAVLLSPFVPLLFMGEEYGERAPFPYFVSHGDPELVAAVRRGRKEEFASFGWELEPPDPQAESTGSAAVLHWNERCEGGGAQLLELTRELLAARRVHPSIRRFDGLEVVSGEATGGAGLLLVVRRGPGERSVLALNFDSDGAAAVLPEGSWRAVLDTADPRFGGAGGESAVNRIAPHAAKLLIQDGA